MALTDALGNLVRFVLLPGNCYDTVGVAPLIKGVNFGVLLGGKACDSNWIIKEMSARDVLAGISQRPQRKEPLESDPVMYRWRPLVENFFCNLKGFRRIAMRSEKTDTSVAAMIYACAGRINSR